MKTGSNEEKVSQSENFWDYFGSQIGQVWTKMGLVMRLMYALILVLVVASTYVAVCGLLKLDLLKIVTWGLIATVSGVILWRDLDIGAAIGIAHWRAANHSASTKMTQK